MSFKHIVIGLHRKNMQLTSLVKLSRLVAKYSVSLVSQQLLPFCERRRIVGFKPKIISKYDYESKKIEGHCKGRHSSSTHDRANAVHLRCQTRNQYRDTSKRRYGKRIRGCDWLRCTGDSTVLALARS